MFSDPPPVPLHQSSAPETSPSLRLEVSTATHGVNSALGGWEGGKSSEAGGNEGGYQPGTKAPPTVENGVSPSSKIPAQAPGSSRKQGVPSIDWAWIFKAPKRSSAATWHPYPGQVYQPGVNPQGGAYTPGSGFWAGAPAYPAPYVPGPGVTAVPPSTSIEATAAAAAALDAQMLSPIPSVTCLPIVATTTPIATLLPRPDSLSIPSVRHTAADTTPQPAVLGDTRLTTGQTGNALPATPAPADGITVPSLPDGGVTPVATPNVLPNSSDAGASPGGDTVMMDVSVPDTPVALATVNLLPAAPNTAQTQAALEPVAVSATAVVSGGNVQSGNAALPHSSLPVSTPQPSAPLGGLPPTLFTGTQPVSTAIPIVGGSVPESPHGRVLIGNGSSALGPEATPVVPATPSAREGPQLPATWAEWQVR